MRVYKVPLSITGESKIIGGKYTLRQVLYLLLGFAVSYFALKALGFIGPIGWALSVFPFLFAVALAFVSVPGKGMGLDRYLWLWFMYSSQPQQFVYHR